MKRTAAFAAAFLVIALAAAPAREAGSAVVHEGPRLGLVELRWQNWPPQLGDPEEEPITSLRTIAPGGEAQETLLHGVSDLKPDGPALPLYFYGPSWSPDGSLLAFAGSDGREELIYLIGADGSGLRAVPGTTGARAPVFSPDGGSLAFSRSRYRLPSLDLPPFLEPRRRAQGYASATTWIVRLDGGRPRRLTEWENGLEHEPTSFSPSGGELLATRNGLSGDPAVVRLRLDGGRPRVLARKAEAGEYSPDGGTIAFVNYRDHDVVKLVEDRVVASELYSMRADGTRLRRLTRTRGVDETAPSWDPAGARIAYLGHRIDPSGFSGLDSLFPVGNAVMQLNADGSCQGRVYAARGAAIYGAEWQPGPGREAGRISC